MKNRAAKVSLAVVTGLIALKMAVAVVTGSLSILAQGIDSFFDVLAVLITFFGVSMADRPPDSTHPFGHGKIENIAALVQAIFIFGAGGFIAYSAIRRLLAGTSVELTEVGIGVMVVSVIVSILLSRYLRRASLATDSIALEAIARNITVDVYSAGAVLFTLIAVHFTGLAFLDPVIALAVTVLIFKAGYDMLRKTSGGLVDTKLPEVEESTIMGCIMEYGDQIVDFHRLRTRRSGSHRHIDLHLVMPKQFSVQGAHRVCDRLEQDIAYRLRGASVTIHVEPCNGWCRECSASCVEQNIKGGYKKETK